MLDNKTLRTLDAALSDPGNLAAVLVRAPQGVLGQALELMIRGGAGDAPATALPGLRELTTDPDRLLREHEVALIVRMSIRGLQAMRARGYGPAWRRVGRVAVRYRAGDVMTWLEETAAAGGNKAA